MKPRLGQPSLTAMQLAFAGQQAFAQHGFGVAQAASLDEVPVVRDQHALNQLRVIDEKQIAPASAEVPHIDAAPAEVADVGSRVSAEPQQFGIAANVFSLQCHAALTVADRRKA
jgi:hypothetical protein